MGASSLDLLDCRLELVSTGGDIFEFLRSIYFDYFLRARIKYPDYVNCGTFISDIRARQNAAGQYPNIPTFQAHCRNMTFTSEN